MTDYSELQNNLKSLVVHTAEAIISSESKLNELDRAIGDGDHGTNMTRGCKALLGAVDEFEYEHPGKVLASIGNTLISSIGGASGALYGTLFLTIGEKIGDDLTTSSWINAFEQGVEEVMALGASHAKQKTMLDVIIPVLDELKQRSGNLSAIMKTASLASDSTIPMKAEKGRASYLGDRSIGHLDPGAYSSQIIICSICEGLKNYE